MAVRVAINGFGRIGRLVLRAAYEHKHSEIEVVGVNDLGSVETNAHLLRYDSVHGRFPGEVTSGDSWMDIGRGKIRVTAERDPAKLPWRELGVDVADLEPQGELVVGDRVGRAGQLQEPAAEEEDRTGGPLPVDVQAEGVLVEAAGPLEVGRSQQHPARQDLHRGLLRHPHGLPCAAMVVRRRVVVDGRVQGVFFRDTCRRVAVDAGVGGWVRNRPDGAVEAEVEGEREAVEALIAWARRGPPAARVTDVEVRWTDPHGERGRFVVR